MTPLPFSLPAALEIGELYASPDVMLVQVYDRYLVAAARAACILSREHHPERPVIVLAELEADGMTADGWEPDALLALFEGVGASALVLACAADADVLADALQDLSARARIPLGVCLPSGIESELLPRMAAAQIFLALDSESHSELLRLGSKEQWVEYHHVHDGERDTQLGAVTCGQFFVVDPAIDIDAVCDVGEEDVARWLLEQEDDSWGVVKMEINSDDDLRIFDENQYMLRVPIALSSADPVMFERAVRRFCGIAIYDGTCDFEDELLERLHSKYGLVIL